MVRAAVFLATRANLAREFSNFSKNGAQTPMVHAAVFLDTIANMARKL